MSRIASLALGVLLVLVGVVSLRDQMGWLFWGLLVGIVRDMATEDPVALGAAVVSIFGGLFLAIAEIVLFLDELREQ